MLTRFLIIVAIVLVALSAAFAYMVNVGEPPYEGELQAQTSAERAIENNLRAALEHFTIQVGPRSLNRAGTLEKGAIEIEERLRKMGYDPDLHEFTVRGSSVRNITVDVGAKSSRSDTVLIGTHYDTYRGSPGAHASGSSVVALLEIARLVKGTTPPFNLRLAFFVNGEMPYHGTTESGAVTYAQFVERDGGKIRFALLLDSLGFFSDKPDSQAFPFPLNLAYPSEGNFLMAFGGVEQRAVVREFIAIWNRRCRFPMEGGSLPFWFPGVTVGDHTAFASQGFPAVVLSDTGAYRHRDSGTSYDLHTRLDYGRLAKVVKGLADVIPDLGKVGR